MGAGAGRRAGLAGRRGAVVLPGGGAVQRGRGLGECGAAGSGGRGAAAHGGRGRWELTGGARGGGGVEPGAGGGGGAVVRGGRRYGYVRGAAGDRAVFCGRAESGDTRGRRGCGYHSARRGAGLRWSGRTRAEERQQRWVGVSINGYEADPRIRRRPVRGGGAVAHGEGERAHGVRRAVGRGGSGAEDSAASGSSDVGWGSTAAARSGSRPPGGVP